MDDPYHLSGDSSDQESDATSSESESEVRAPDNSSTSTAIVIARKAPKKKTSKTGRPPISEFETELVSSSQAAALAPPEWPISKIWMLFHDASHSKSMPPPERRLYQDLLPGITTTNPVDTVSKPIVPRQRPGVEEFEILKNLFDSQSDQKEIKSMAAVFGYEATDKTIITLPEKKPPRTSRRKIKSDDDDDYDDDSDDWGEDGLVIKEGWGKHNHLDYQAPPLSDIDEIFSLIAQAAVSKGFLKACSSFASKGIRVFTMCSGTESPFISMNLLQKALARQGHGDKFKYQHLGSAEIEPQKQAFIERNFAPPVIFRDVGEFIEHGKDPTNEDKLPLTAYGARAKPPEAVHILIAGSSCVDYSNLNRSRKKEKGDGESGRTFEGIAAYAKAYHPTLILLENVAGAPYQELQKEWQAAGYDFGGVAVDTLDFYLPQTRSRVYGLGINKSQAKDAGLDCNEVIREWVRVLATFQRRASSPYTEFTLPDDDPRVLLAKDKPDTKASNSDWSKCRQRHLVVRNTFKLGTGNPYTNRVSNSKPKASDEAWQAWLLRQSVRVQDALDINLLKNVALRDLDFRFKHRNINVSQNVDRDIDQRQWGVLGCITPNGCVWDSRRSGPLSGLEVFHLQGMPIGDLSLGKESSRHLQDLAGNAMSTTVIGSAIVSAIIAFENVKEKSSDKTPSIFQKYADVDQGDEPLVIGTSPIDDISEEPLATASSHPQPPLVEAFETFPRSPVASLPKLVSLAARSEPLCRCESHDRRTKYPLKYCPGCFYTCCQACSRDSHDGLKDLWMSQDAPRFPARDFILQLTAALPPFLALEHHVGAVEELNQLFTSKALKPAITEMLNALQGELQFLQVRFDGTWKAVYESDLAKLELEFVKVRYLCTSCAEFENKEHLHMGVSPMWFLFAKTPAAKALKCPERSILQHPIARMKPSESFFDGIWELWKGPQKSFGLLITGIGEEVPSWEQDLGLEEAPFSSLNVFSRLEVSLASQPTNELPDIVQRIVGTYDALRHCPASSNTLHRKVSTSPDDDKPTWLFLNARPLEDAFSDRMIFATHAPRQNLVDERVILMRVTERWRPIATPGLAKGQEVRCEVLSQWSCSALKLAASTQKAQIRKWHSDTNLPIELTSLCDENISTIMRVSMSHNKELKDNLQHVQSLQIDLENKPDALKGCEWVASHANDIPHLRMGWQDVSHMGVEHCQKCWPTPPKLKWVLNDKDKVRGVEDTYEAAQYEQLTKNRPRSAVAAICIRDDEAILDIGVNVQTLAHRAISQFSLSSAPELALRSVAWRVDRYQPFEHLPTFGPLRIQSNTSGNEIQATRVGTRELWVSQRKLLSWMQSQENSPPLWEELALAESCMPALGWRLEARALVSNSKVRGGIIADEVGAGKTTTSLALVSFDHEQRKSGTGAFTTSPQDGHITSDATLILVPRNIIGQWALELTETLNWTEMKPQSRVKPIPKRQPRVKPLSTPYFLVIRNTQSLQEFTLEQIRSAAIILAPWALFQDGSYWLRFSETTCAKNVPTNPGRPFQEWLDQASSTLASSVDRLQQNEQSFWSHWDANRQDLTSYDKYVLPINRKKANDNAKGDAKTQGQKRKRSDSNADGKKEEKTVPSPEEVLDAFRKQKTVPVLLHMFAFRRLILDEFTYIEGKTLLGLLKIEATTKWLLSGTPPIHDYDKMNTMAKLLDTRISTYDEESGKYGFGKDKAKMTKDSSSANEFQSYRSLVSMPYKKSMYEHADRFAGTFIRKNRPSHKVPAKVEEVIEFDLSPGELVTYQDVERLLDQPRTFNRKSTPPISPDEATFMETQLTAAVERTSGPQQALICSAAMQHKILNILTDDFITREEEILEKMVKDQMEFLRLKCHQLLRWVRELWGGANMVGDEKPAFTATFAQLQANVEDGTFAEKDMMVTLDHMIWWAKQHPLDPRERLTVAKTVTTAAAKKAKTGKADAAAADAAAELDSAMMHTATGGKEMAARVARVATITETLGQGLGRLRLLQLAFAVGSQGALAPCSYCGNVPIDHQMVKFSPLCGHIVVCANCSREEEMVDWSCCPAYEPSNSVLAGLLTLEAPELLGEVRGARMREVATLIKSFPDDDFTLVFSQFNELRDSFVEECKRGGIAVLDGTRWTTSKVGQFRKAAEGRVTKGKGDEQEVTPRVLVLQVDSPDAAGWNLHCANRVVFLAPVVAESSEERVAIMTQAIGRSWRPRQTKVVHVYHLAARGTIEVGMVTPS